MLAQEPAPQAAPRPNVILIMADDLGYGDLGCYGQKLIQTPVLDRMAADGVRFRQFYAGCTVCAPSRCVLMTGKHMGHARVRGNGAGSRQALQDDDVTLAELAKRNGYATAMCGKWGLGDDQDGARAGLPNDQGFDLFFGYLNQLHAHNYYPRFLWRNKQKIGLRNVVVDAARSSGGFRGGHAAERRDYSHDLIMYEALEFIREQRNGPFFLYVPLTIPHANNEGTRATGNGQETPSYAPYDKTDWPDPDKGQAAMITRMDAGIGKMFELLADLKLDANTLVFFTSDNGPHNEGGHDPARFGPSGPLRGMKRDLYEGGIRVPLIARWPGRIQPNEISEHAGSFQDFFATLADLMNDQSERPSDSISFLPTLVGDPEKQQEHEYLYWEFYERGGKQAVLHDQWKAVRMPMFTGPTELYNLSDDLGEAENVGATAPRRRQAVRGLHAASSHASPAMGTLRQDGPPAAPRRREAPILSRVHRPVWQR